MIIAEKNPPSAEDSDVLVPLSIYQTGSGADIYVYPDFEESAKRLFEEFDDLFSREAIEFCESELREKTEALGFFREEDSRGRLYFDFTAEKAPDSELILPSTVALTPETARGLRSSLELFDDLSDGLLFYAEVSGGEIVSAACENGASDGDISEIEIETAPGFRRRGLGSSCAAALITALLSQGRRISYVVRDDNAPSILLAERLGLIFERKIFYYDCYRGI